MKRSEINAALCETEQALRLSGITLPPFCDIAPADWPHIGHDHDGVRSARLGWDITDYGLGRFDEIGLALVTLRNGRPDDAARPYAEKLLYLREGQYSPNHFHWSKTEDIINRSGGVLLIRVFASRADESVDTESDVTVFSDGVTSTVPAGAVVRLLPGMSLTIPPRLYHDFRTEPHTGAVIIGEVSRVNDDEADNRFEPPMGRFPTVYEDEPPYRLLCFEYPEAKEE